MHIPDYGSGDFTKNGAGFPGSAYFRHMTYQLYFTPTMPWVSL